MFEYVIQKLNLIFTGLFRIICFSANLNILNTPTRFVINRLEFVTRLNKIKISNQPIIRRCPESGGLFVSYLGFLIEHA